MCVNYTSFVLSVYQICLVNELKNVPGVQVGIKIFQGLSSRFVEKFEVGYYGQHNQRLWSNIRTMHMS